jgi:hypothetical protein
MCQFNPSLPDPTQIIALLSCIADAQVMSPTPCRVTSPTPPTSRPEAGLSDRVVAAFLSRASRRAGKITASGDKRGMWSWRVPGLCGWDSESAAVS